MGRRAGIRKPGTDNGMARSISLLLSRSGGSSSQGSVGYVNGVVPQILRRSGWELRPFQPPQAGPAQETTLPFGLASVHAAALARGPADVALYDDAGAAIRTPSRRWAKRNLVLYHGLAYGSGAWMANPEIDLHCANSPYLARVLRALLAFPDWQGRRCLDERAFDIVTDLHLPVPCTADPDGSPAFSYGADVPPMVARLLDGPLILGHALQPQKQDLFATLSILYWLNEIARQHGCPRVKLLISAASLDADRRRTLDAALAPTGTRCDDFFVPMPHLNQRALFRLMRACRFGLAYNRFPEPFGFYVLESVHNGCPIYTNGAGNNRFLLPADHGIVVHETADMVGETVDASAYRSVAERIHADFGRADAMQAACRRGSALVDLTWSPDAFARSLTAAIDRVEGPSAPPAKFDDLVVALGPLVRSLDFNSGRCLNDYASITLDGAAIAAVQRVLGARCANLDPARMQQIEDQHGLFRRGILTLLPPQEIQLAA